MYVFLCCLGILAIMDYRIIWIPSEVVVNSLARTFMPLMTLIFDISLFFASLDDSIVSLVNFADWMPRRRRYYVFLRIETLFCSILSMFLISLANLLTNYHTVTGNLLQLKVNLFLLLLTLMYNILHMTTLIMNLLFFWID